MKTMVGAGLAVLLAATAVSAQRWSSSRARIYSEPAVPSAEVLRRLNLTLGWSRIIPTDGRRDAVATVQLAGPDLFVQTRSGLIVRLDAETGVVRWRVRVGKAYEGGSPLAYNSRA